jgi:hypothetical protein
MPERGATSLIARPACAVVDDVGRSASRAIPVLLMRTGPAAVSLPFPTGPRVSGRAVPEPSAFPFVQIEVGVIIRGSLREPPAQDVHLHVTPFQSFVSRKGHLQGRRSEGLSLMGMCGCSRAGTVFRGLSAMTTPAGPRGMESRRGVVSRRGVGSPPTRQRSTPQRPPTTGGRGRPIAR